VEPRVEFGLLLDAQRAYPAIGLTLDRVLNQATSLDRHALLDILKTNLLAIDEIERSLVQRIVQLTRLQRQR